MLGTQATTSIICKNLAKQSAPVGMLTGFFSLVITNVNALTKVTGSGGTSSGLAYPGEAHNLLPQGTVQNFYQPTEEQFLHVPRDKEHEYFTKWKNVKLTIKFGNTELEKIYQVNESSAKRIVTIVNLMNKTRDKITVSINNIERLYNKINITIKNMFKRNGQS